MFQAGIETLQSDILPLSHQQAQRKRKDLTFMY